MMSTDFQKKIRTDAHLVNLLLSGPGLFSLKLKSLSYTYNAGKIVQASRMAYLAASWHGRRCRRLLLDREGKIDIAPLDP